MPCRGDAAQCLGCKKWGFMKIRPIVAMAVLFLLGVSACDSARDLTRSRAKSLIASSDPFQKPTRSVRLSEEEVQTGLTAGYWTRQPGFLTLPSYLQLTAKGKGLFAGFEPQLGGDVVIDTKQPVRRTVSAVTGITGNDADFLWNLDFTALSPEARELFKNHPDEKGQASFTLYDDGWRLSGLADQ